jgi:hypothetical protein
LDVQDPSGQSSQVNLLDDGAGPDSTADDGTYTGSLSMPDMGAYVLTASFDSPAEFSRYDVVIVNACPPSTDCDGDGYTDTDEFSIGTSPLERCGVGVGPDPSTAWPSDFISGSIPISTDRITIGDLVSFIAPVRYFGTDTGTNPGDERWDLQPGPGLLLTDININDLAAMIAGTTGNPPMGPYAGTRAFGAAPPPCDNTSLP